MLWADEKHLPSGWIWYRHQDPEGDSEGDPGQGPFLSQIGAELEPLRGKGLELMSVAHADHTFNDVTIRQDVMEWIGRGLS